MDLEKAGGRCYCILVLEIFSDNAQGYAQSQSTVYSQTYQIPISITH